MKLDLIPAICRRVTSSASAFISHDSNFSVDFKAVCMSL